MRTILTFVVLVGLIAVLALDGVGMYSAHTRAVKAAQVAARQAAVEYVSSQGSQTAAEQVADQVAQTSDARLVSVDFHKADTQWVEVTVRAIPRVYLLGYVPYLKTHLAQQSTAVVHF
jgi:hypothetical protein